MKPWKVVSLQKSNFGLTAAQWSEERQQSVNDLTKLLYPKVGMLDIGFSADIWYSDTVQLLGRWDLEIVPNHRHLMHQASKLVSHG